MVVTHKWPLLQIDLNNTFLYGDVFEEVLMDLLLGYKPQIPPTYSKLVCKLRKSIYGLRQSILPMIYKFYNDLIVIAFT